MARNKKPRKHPKKDARITARFQQMDEAALKGVWDNYLKVKPKKEKVKK